jgi:hypothetical protein
VKTQNNSDNVIPTGADLNTIESCWNYEFKENSEW